MDLAPLVLIALGGYAYVLYVCLQKGKTALFWIGIPGLFPALMPLLGWFPLAGALRPAKEGSAWETKDGSRKTSETSSTAGPPPPSAEPISPDEEMRVIGRFLARASGARIISDEVKARLLLFLADPERAKAEGERRRLEATWTGVASSTTTPETAAPPPSSAPVATPHPPAAAPQPQKSSPRSAPPQPAPSGSRPPARTRTPKAPPTSPRTPVTPPAPAMASPVPSPVEPSPPREPSALSRRLREMRENVSADVALHGFAYLGVLLTFVGVLGFLLFAFVDVPDAVQPIVELFIASVFFGWAFVLHRQAAHSVAKALELLGGAILPLILFAGLVDNAPIPPDVTGAPLVVVMPLVSLGVAFAYARIAHRRPDTMLRYLVMPLVWLAALAAGFAFKTDEALVSDAITRLVAPQPALAAIAVAVTLWPRIRARVEAAQLPVALPALVATPLVYAMALGLSVGASAPMALAATVAGVATVVSVRFLSLEYGQERYALLGMPLLLAVAVVPTVPQVGVAAAGAVGAIGYLALGAWFVRERIDDRDAWALAAAGLLAGLGMSLQAPGAALVAFGAAGSWLARRRVAGLPLTGVGPLVTGAAALTPVGVGWSLWQLLDPSTAALVMAAVLLAIVLMARRTGTEDVYWAWWPTAAAGIVATSAIALVGLAPLDTITVSGAVVLLALGLLALAVAAGQGHFELRLLGAVAVVTMATMPYFGVAWAAAMGTTLTLAVLERLVRIAGRDELSWLTGTTLATVGLVATLADPWAAVVAFGLASAWTHWRRPRGLPVESVDELVVISAAALPFGFGWGIWQVMPFAPAVVMLSGLVVLTAAVVRMRRIEDPFWQWWPAAPAVVLVVAATAPVGLGRIDAVTSSLLVSTLAFVLAALTVVLGRGFDDLRRLLAAMLTVVATAPYVGAGWSGAIGTLVLVGFVEVMLRMAEPEPIASVASSVGVVVTLGFTFTEPGSALAAFSVASIWMQWRRSVGVPVEGMDRVITGAAAILPVGLGWALWQVLGAAPAVLVMASVAVTAAGLARWRRNDDGFWQWWPAAVALIVAVLALGLIGPNPAPPLDATTSFLLVSLALVTATAGLGVGFVVGRTWSVAAFLVLDLHLLLETSGAAPTVRAVTWALLGLGIVVVATLRRTPWFDHLATIGHLVALGAVTFALGPTGRAVAMTAWSVGLVVSLVAEAAGRGSTPRLLRRLAGAMPVVRHVGWIVPVVLVVSVPIALLMSLNLWDTFAENRAWSGLATGATAVAFSAMARRSSWPREVRGPLTISGSFYVVVAVAVTAPVPWPSIVAAAMTILVAVLVASTIRSTALSWFAWVMSGVLLGLLGDRAGLDADGVRLLVLGIALLYFVGGLVADDRLAGRRRFAEGLRVPWLRFPVLLGALAVPGTLGSIMALEPSAAPVAALAVAVGYLGVAWLLKSALVTVPAYALMAYAVAYLAPVAPADQLLLLPGVAAALLGVSLSVWMFGDRHRPIWDAWDVPPLVVAHGVALLALGLAAVETAPLPWIVVGALSGTIGVWRRVRYWIDVGHALVIVGAAFVGVGAVASVLALTSVRAMNEARLLVDWRRLIAHAVATLSAAAAWVLTVEWAGWTVHTTTSLTAVVFGGAAVLAAVLAARTRILLDSCVSWLLLSGGGVAYSMLAVFIGGAAEGTTLLLAGPAVGVVLAAAAAQITRVTLEEVPAYVPVAIGGMAWPVLVVFAGWEAGPAVTVSAWLGGLVVLATGEAVRRRLLPEMLTAHAWVFVGLGYFAGALFGAADGSERSLWATAIASGAVLVAGGLARAADLDEVVVPVASVAALELAISALLYGLAGEAGAIVIAHLIASTAGSLVLLRLGRRRGEHSLWARPVALFVVMTSVVAAIAASTTVPDLRLVTAVLLVVGLQAAFIGIVWRRGEVIALAPPAVGSAVLLLVAESAVGIVEWYMLPVALVLLAEIELVGRYPIGRAAEAEAPDLVWAEWLAVGLGVLPAVVDMFIRSLASSFLVFGFAALLLVWAVLTRLRRRAVAAAAVAVAAAVLVVTAALAGAAPESSLFWIMAVGLGFAVMSVAGVVEAMRSHRGFVVRRFDELMGGWR